MGAPDETVTDPTGQGNEHQNHGSGYGINLHGRVQRHTCISLDIIRQIYQRDIESNTVSCCESQRLKGFLLVFRECLFEWRPGFMFLISMADMPLVQPPYLGPGEYTQQQAH